MSKVLFVLGGSLDVGGAERQLQVLAPALLSHGYQVEVLCLWKRGALADDLVARGVPVTAIPAAIGGMRGPFAKLARLVAGWLAVRGEIRRFSPDILHLILPHAYVVGGFATLWTKGLVRVMSRRGLNRYLQGRPLARWQETYLHRHMDVLLGNSMAVAQELVSEGADHKRVGLIYNGIVPGSADVDLDRYEVRRVLGVPRDALMLIKVANLWQYKGHADLLAALARVDLGGDWRLVLVGRDQGERSALQRQAQRLGLAERVIFVGSRNDVPELLAAADIGISASHEEGFSNAVLEYLAAGLATVVTDVGGNAEAVGETGEVVPARDVDSLTAALMRMADPSYRHRLAGLARARAALFNMDSCVQSYVQLYQSLLAGKGLPGDLRITRELQE